MPWTGGEQFLEETPGFTLVLLIFLQLPGEWIGERKERQPGSVLTSEGPTEEQRDTTREFDRRNVLRGVSLWTRPAYLGKKTTRDVRTHVYLDMKKMMVHGTGGGGRMSRVQPRGGCH